MAYILQDTTSCGYSYEIWLKVMVKETFLLTSLYFYFFSTIPCDMHVFIFQFFQWPRLIQPSYIHFLFYFWLVRGTKVKPRIVVWHYIGFQFFIFLNFFCFA